MNGYFIDLRLLISILFLPLAALCQCVTGDCVSGKGEYKLKNAVYSGEFLDGEIHGDGEFSTKRGYAYSGSWKNGMKDGHGNESLKKIYSYTGGFSKNRRHGYGTASMESSKYMQNINYSGNWFYGTICGKGEITYSRQVKYGREKVVEKNTLQGDFVNGVFQGRQTSPYSDELKWQAFDLKMSNFQKYYNPSEKERKKLKNPATMEGDILVDCKCVDNIIVFNATALFRQDLSWWSTKDIPTKTKTIVLNSRQREFDIIEWHARALQAHLNKQKLTCSSESIEFFWQEFQSFIRESDQIRKQYNVETAWNPKKGIPKNTSVQEKWNNKISKKLKKYEKINEKFSQKKSKKSKSKVDKKAVCQEMNVDLSICPVIPKAEVIKIEEPKKIKKTRKNHVGQMLAAWNEGWQAQAQRRENKKEENKLKAPRSSQPQFPRSQQLE